MSRQDSRIFLIFYPRMHFLIGHGRTRTDKGGKTVCPQGDIFIPVVSASGMTVSVKIHPECWLYLYAPKVQREGHSYNGGFVYSALFLLS